MKMPFADLKLISRLLSNREKWKFLLLFLLMMVAAVLEAIGVGAVPVFVAFIMEPSSLGEHAFLGDWFPEFPAEPTLSLIIWASAILFGFVLFKNGFLAGFAFIQSYIVAMQRARLADRMFRAYQKAPYDWLLQRSTSELQRNIMEDTTRILNGVVMPYLDLMLTIPLSLAIIGAMAIATPGVTLISILVIGVGIFAIIHLMRTKMRRAGGTLRLEYGQSLKAIQQGIGALVDARIARCEEALAKQHRNTAIRLSKAQVVGFTATRATPAAIDTLAIMGLLVVLLVILGAGNNLTSALPTLSVIGVAMVRLKQVAARAAQALHLIHQFSHYIPALLRDLDELSAFESSRHQFSSQERLIIDFEVLELKDVSYTYPNTDSPAVKGASLKLRKGESIAFVGATGCGKSTLANLILGLLEPQVGSIEVNGVDIRRDPDGWRSCLGYIPQNIFLIDDTIRANIAFGRPTTEIDEERITSCLKSAALTDFVSALPDGLDTVVGEAGVRLSGGERQRLGIARALYLQPQILVMDEATSALDYQTEVEVMRAIENLQRDHTFIMIAHRLSTVESCDRLYVLSAGKIESFGAHELLLETCDRFRRMVAS